MSDYKFAIETKHLDKTYNKKKNIKIKALIDFNIKSVTNYEDSQGHVTVNLESDNKRYYHHTDSYINENYISQNRL